MIPFRIGFGYDSHRFETGRRLVLSGVEFPGETGLAGHSDADVLVHAVIDALLGAAGLGDIGTLFPDTDAAWKDADSARLLAIVVARVRDAGWRIGNVDATVICERPKLKPRVDAVRERLASLLGVEPGDVSIKGKTNEKMDATGQGVGIAVHCVALIAR
jgi:2-C-methyl-D-erythritol 2,4-cyclodiphosphate synthase